MVVEIRLYKQFDTDLVALADAGYSVSSMIKAAVKGYANGYPVHFYIDEIIPFDMNDKKTVHTRFTIPESDKKTCYLLRNIKHGYRNTFCKAVLRNSLIQQNLTGFFAGESLFHLQTLNMQDINIYTYKNLVPCSKIRGSAKQVTFLGRTVTVERKPIDSAPVFIPGNNYPNMQNPFIPTGSAVEQMPVSDRSNVALENSNPYVPYFNAGPTQAGEEKSQPPVLSSFTQNKIAQVKPAPAVIVEDSTNMTTENQSIKNENNVQNVHVSTEETPASIKLAENDDLMNIFDAL